MMGHALGMASDNAVANESLGLARPCRLAWPAREGLALGLRVFDAGE